MFFNKKVLRRLGALLLLAGLAILVLACAGYVQQTQTEKQAEARVPGQGTQPTPVILPTLAPNTATPTQVASPTATRIPTQPPPTATPTVQMVVGANGLQPGRGAVPVRLVIPRMKLDTQVDEATWDVVDQNDQQVSEWQIPYDAAGHLKTTPKPGEVGNAVISGHNNLTAPNVFGVGLFAGLWNLQQHDPIYLTDALGRTFLFQVQTYYYVQELGVAESVREQHYQQMVANTNTPTITLETCWNGYAAPLSGNTYRWVVRAQLIGTVDGSKIPSVNG